VFVTAITVVPRPFQENVRVYYACMGKVINNGREEVERAVRAKQQDDIPLMDRREATSGQVWNGAGGKGKVGRGRGVKTGVTLVLYTSKGKIKRYRNATSRRYQDMGLVTKQRDEGRAGNRTDKWREIKRGESVTKTKDDRLYANLKSRG